jgi:hypothetical protein
MIRFLINKLNARRTRAMDRAPRRRRRGDDVMDLALLTAGVSVWIARERGSCCTCGHEWEPGELIGNVTQAYVLFDDGTVMRCPGVRLACALCVEHQRQTGDLSLLWARDAGLIP